VFGYRPKLHKLPALRWDNILRCARQTSLYNEDAQPYFSICCF